MQQGDGGSSRAAQPGVADLQVVLYPSSPSVTILIEIERAGLMR